MIPCLKQETTCIIVLNDYRVFEASNACNVDGLDICPRVTAGCETGTGYELCGSTHAEANAAAQIPEDSITVGGVAFLYGHNWFCRDCQLALQAKGIFNFIPRDEEIKVFGLAGSRD